MANERKPLTLTKDNFSEKVLESSRPTLVDFWADITIWPWVALYPWQRIELSSYPHGATRVPDDRRVAGRRAGLANSRERSDHPRRGNGEDMNVFLRFNRGLLEVSLPCREAPGSWRHCTV